MMKEEQQKNESSSPATINNDSATALPIENRRRKFACVECRQQKSKCDAHDRAPLPCTKCEKKGVKCVLKKDFRRTYKRARNEAIEKRFKELTKSLTNLSSDEILEKIKEEQQTLLDNSNFTKEKVKKLKKIKNDIDFHNHHFDNIKTTSDIINNNRIDVKIENENNTNRNVEDSIDLHVSEDLFICTPKNLGDIYMSSEDISELFREFATRYHHFLPVVDLSKGAERIYSLSPCLFWVILLIGLRRSKISKKYENDLLNRLSILVKTTLAEITISPIIRYTPSDIDEPILNVASVYSVQAFLLYTFWPPLTSSLSADTSWNTIGTAMFQAIRVGLNCADFSREYATINYELIKEQRRTWICCNVVSQIIASSFGFPSYVSFDHAVMSSINNYSNINLNQNQDQHKMKNNVRIPVELRQMTQIAHFENQMTNTMNSNPSNKLGMVSREERQPLLHVLDQQLSQLEFNLKSTKIKNNDNDDNNIDDIRKFLLLVAKVHLLTYYFPGDDSSMDKNSSIDNVNFETKRGLVRVYNSAINLLSHANEMSKRDPEIIKYFPGCFVLNIWQSACIIGKLVHSSLSSIIDIKKGNEAYRIATRLTLQASVLKHDMAYRSSGIMRSIWSLFANMYEAWEKNNHNNNNNNNNNNNMKEVGNANEDKDFNLGITIKSRMSVSVFFDCLYILKAKCGMAKLRRESGQSTKKSKKDYLLHNSEDNLNDQGYDEEDEDYDEEEEEGEDVDPKKNKENDKDQPVKRSLFSTTKHPEKRARRIIETIPLDPNPINAGEFSNSRHDPHGKNSTRASSMNTNNSLIRSPISVESLRTMYNSLDGTHTMLSGTRQGSPVGSVPISFTNDHSNSDNDNNSKNNNHNESNFETTDSLFNTQSRSQSQTSVMLNSYIQSSSLNKKSDYVNQPLRTAITGNPQVFPISHEEGTLKDQSHTGKLVTASTQIQNQEDSNLISLDEPNITTPGNTISRASTTGTSTRESPNSVMAGWDNWESDMVWKDVDILMNEFAFNPTV